MLLFALHGRVSADGLRYLSPISHLTIGIFANLLHILHELALFDSRLTRCQVLLDSDFRELSVEHITSLFGKASDNQLIIRDAAGKLVHVEQDLGCSVPHVRIGVLH